MRFDYYAATVPEEGRWAVGAILDNWQQGLGEVRNTRGMHGYDHGAEIVLEGQRMAFLWWTEGTGQAHIQASGTPAHQMAQDIRMLWPKHRVARADVCLDYLGGRPVWTTLRNQGIQVAQVHRLKCREITDPADEGGGRTLYLGSETSVMRARIYEKGLHPEAQQQQIPEDAVRLEFQVRPSSRAKAVLAQLEPERVPAGSKWATALVTAAGELPGEPWQPGTIWNPPQLERAMEALVRQYGNTLDQYRTRVGSWEKVGAYLGARIEAQNSRKGRP